MNNRRGAKGGVRWGARGFATSGRAAGASVPPSRPPADRTSPESGPESGRRHDGAGPDPSASRSERNGLLKYGLTTEIPPALR